MQRLLIPLQGQHIVGVAVDDLLGNRFLSSHRVDGDDGSRDVYQPQQLGNSGDFVGFLVTGNLSQRQAEFAGPDAHRVQRAQAVALIVAAPIGFAVHRVHRLVDAARLGRLGPQRLQPLIETGLKRRRVQQHQHPAKDIFAGDAGRQRQHLPQELFLERGPASDGRRPRRARQHGHQSDDHHADQRVLPIDGRTRILQVVEMGNNLVQVNPVNRCHDSSSVNAPTGCRHRVQLNHQRKPGASLPSLPGLPKSARWP